MEAALKEASAFCYAVKDAPSKRKQESVLR